MLKLKFKMKQKSPKDLVFLLYDLSISSYKNRSEQIKVSTNWLCYVSFWMEDHFSL